MKGAAAALVLGGCSAMWSAGPGPSGPGDPPVRCTSERLPIIDTVAFAVAAIALANSPDCNGNDCGTKFGWIAVTIPVTGAFALSAVDGAVETASCHAAARAQKAALPAYERARSGEEATRAANAARERAYELMKQAAAAARAGDCASVRDLDAQVRMASADFYVAVFVRDAAIARCLAPP